MQNGHVICYESTKIKEHEKKYVTHDLELVTIVHVLKMWRQYRMGMKFELRTDHSGLKYLFEKKNMNVRQTRWLEFMCEFDFDTKHIKGKENKVVDALSTRVHAMHATTISMCKSDLKARILEIVISYQRYIQVTYKLQHENVKQKFKGYRLDMIGFL